MMNQPTDRGLGSPLLVKILGDVGDAHISQNLDMKPLPSLEVLKKLSRSLPPVAIVVLNL